MEQAVTAEQPAKTRDERRRHPRFEVEEPASLQLIAKGGPMECHILDLSSGGCRVRLKERFLAGAMVRVEIGFRVRGFAFRLGGVVQWTDKKNQIGIRFAEMSDRRRLELAEAIGEVEEVARIKARRAETEAQAAEEAARRISEQVAVRALAEQQAARAKAGQQAAERALAEASLAEDLARKGLPAPPPAPARRERRAQVRHEVDTSATIFLVRGGSNLTGRILDLSLGGCRIRTDERFPVGIYTRVEIEFRLEGLAFRLSGVIQSIHDRQMVGIRLLDLSPRKREQVEQLIEEMQQMRELGAETGGLVQNQ
jgi:c-di-GMP-binding flagellar brake protein YcgR